MIRTSQVLAFSLFIFCFTGCQVDPPLTTTMNDFYRKYAPESQHFTIDTETGGKISMPSGVEIFIPNGTFIDQGGKPYKGIVDLEVKPILKKRHMVLSGIHTTSNGLLLESAGMVYINATEENGDRPLRTEGQIGINLPTDNIQLDMQLFNGMTANTSFNTSTNGFPLGNFSDWVPVDSLTWGWFNDIDFDTIYPLKYLLTIAQLGFINCDRFYNDPRQKTSMTVHVTGGFNVNSYDVSIVFKNINSVMKLNYNNTVSNIPVGAEVTLVALGIKDEKEFLATKDVVITANMTETLHPLEATQSEIMAELEKLDN